MANEEQSNIVLIWARNLTSILIGWNVFITLIFLVLILMSIILNTLGIEFELQSGIFYTEVILAALISIVGSAEAGKQSLKWLKKRKPPTIYSILSLSLILTILLFPRTFTYTL